MDKEGNPLVGADNGGTSVIPEKKPSGSEDKNERALRVQIVLAVITAITTITVAVLSSPLVHPDPTPIPIAPSSTPFVSDTPTRLPIDTATPVLLPSLTYTPTVFVTPTEPATIQSTPAPVLVPSLAANKTTGGLPLIVKFDARDSFLRESDGTQISCQLGACYYTWKVFFNHQQAGKSVNNTSGKFEYTFRERGPYTVTVYICRGQDRVDCGDTAAWIEVTK